MRNGIVTLTGTLDPKTGPHGDLIPLAIRLMWGVDGVVDVIDKLGEPRPVTPAKPHRPSRQAKWGERPRQAGIRLCPWRTRSAWNEKQRPGTEPGP